MKKTLTLAVLTLFCATLFAGTGTKDDPYTCAEAIALQKQSGYNQTLTWVKGFIVGVPTQGAKGKIVYTTEVGTEQCKQLALADDADGSNWIPVKLTSDTSNAAYKALNLCNNPDNIGKKVVVRTVPQSFYGIAGAQNLSEYEWLTPIAVTGVTLSKNEAEIFVNQALELVATIAPADADNKHLSWTSSNAGVASVDANGTVTALTNGTATITVTTADGAFTASCNITVTSATGEVQMGDVITSDTTGITVNSLKDNQPNTWSNKKGISGTIYAGKTATDNGNMKLAGGAGTDQAGIINTTSVGYIRQIIIEWGTANSADRTINVYGTNVKWNGVSDLYNGTSKTVTDGDIIGTLNYVNDDKTAFDTVNVEGNYQYVGLWATSGKAHYFKKVSFIWALTKAFDDVELTQLTLDSTQLTLEEENTHKLNVSFAPTNATYKAVTWSSSNTAVATVEAGLVTAVAPGKATISVTSTANPEIKATCEVTVTKYDIWAGRDIYYQVKSLDELHTDDTVIFVNKAYRRVSGTFELTEKKNKNAGYISTPSTEIIVSGDSIAAWGAEEIHLVVVDGKWKILVKQWGVDELGLDVSEELALRADTLKSLQVKGEGVQTWTIAFHNDGDSVVIASTDAKMGRIQFNANNKTFCNYTSNQGAVQIYRKLAQTTNTDGPKPDPQEPDTDPNPEPDPDPDTNPGDALNVVTLEGVTYADGIVYNTENLPLQIYSVSGMLMKSGCNDIDITSFERGIYIICSDRGAMKIVK